MPTSVWLNPTFDNNQTFSLYEFGLYPSFARVIGGFTARWSSETPIIKLNEEPPWNSMAARPTET